MGEGDLLRRDAVAARVGAGSKRAALGAVAEIASRRLGLPAQQLLYALQEREKAQGKLDVLDMEGWKLTRHVLAGGSVHSSSAPLNNVLDYSGH